MIRSHRDSRGMPRELHLGEADAITQEVFAAYKAEHVLGPEGVRGAHRARAGCYNASHADAGEFKVCPL